MTTGPDEQAESPQKWWQTGYMRAMFDFGWLAQPEVEGKFFRSELTLTDYAKQLRTLEKQFQIFLVLSFIGASIILAGGLPKGGDIGLFGIDVPANLITLQLIAVFVSGCFIQCLRGLASYMILSGMIAKLLELIPHGSEFVIARYDASHLWMNLLKRREVGYRSPIFHLFANGLFSFAGLIYLLLHFSIVGTALWAALHAAWLSGAASFAFFISFAASLNFAAALILFLLGFFVPLPYPASQDLKQFWASQKGDTAGDSNGHS